MRAPRPGSSLQLFARSSGPVVTLNFCLAVVLGLWCTVPGLCFGRWHGRPWEPAAPRTAQTLLLRQADGALLPANQAISLSQPCSREAPPLVRRVWLPSAGDLQHLETDLAGVLRTIEDTLTRMPGLPPLRLREYRRQYAGLELVTGERIIYINAFHPAELRTLVDIGRDTGDWRQVPVHVCDGWRYFWGVEYDPASRRFRSFAFNGIA